MREHKNTGWFSSLHFILPLYGDISDKVAIQLPPEKLKKQLLQGVGRGVFSLVIGVAFILADKGSSKKGREPSGSYHFPYFLAPDKASQPTEDDVFLIKELESCQQPRLAQQPDCSWIDLSLWSENILTAGTVYAPRREEEEEEERRNKSNIIRRRGTDSMW